MRREITKEKFIVAFNRQRRCDILLKHAYTVLLVKKVYEIYQARKLEYNEARVKVYCQFKIAFWFRQYMKRRFGTSN